MIQRHSYPFLEKPWGFWRRRPERWPALQLSLTLLTGCHSHLLWECHAEVLWRQEGKTKLGQRKLTDLRKSLKGTVNSKKYYMLPLTYSAIYLSGFFFCVICWVLEISPVDAEVHLKHSTEMSLSLNSNHQNLLCRSPTFFSIFLPHFFRWKSAHKQLGLLHICVTSWVCDLVMYDPLLCGQGIS